MPQTKTITTYKYSELSEAAKEKARIWYYESAVSFDWWETTYEDAEQCGITITGFNDNPWDISGRIDTSPDEVSDYIMTNHGDSCETYAVAAKYKQAMEELGDRPSEVDQDADDDNWEEKRDRIHDDFCRDILHCYLDLLKKELDYIGTEEYAVEGIEANDYDFTETGEVA